MLLCERGVGGVWGDETWHFGGVFCLGNGRFQAVFCKKTHFFA